MKIMVAGDTHGSIRHARLLIQSAVRNGVTEIVQVGDFGYLWKGDTSKFKYLDEILRAARIRMTWIDGNHEDYRLMEAMAFRHQVAGAISYSKSLRYVGRGGRFEFDGIRFMGFGGAASVNVDLCTPGIDWFPEELITDRQMGVVLDGPAADVDVLITHEAPGNPEKLTSFLKSGLGGEWPAKHLHTSLGQRTRVQLIHDHVTPMLHIHGHYHFPYTEPSFHGMIVGLASNADPKNSFTILDTEILAEAREARYADDE